MPDPITRLNQALEGRYRIERQLGEGGMATVYLADDVRHERKVALKVLKPELAAVVGAERFLAEIKTTANLQHPHILPLFDSGEADSFVYYVMPHVEGESLRERLDREAQLPVDEAVRIATDAAEALDHAHRQGVVHRDIKPDNILLRDGRPLITDFGIALAMSTAGGGRLTETGLSLGTPRYMSPEQATGEQHVGPATDIYSLGCVLCEMLVGEPPYTGRTPQAILGKIIAGEPESVRAQRKSVPVNVDAAIRKALEKLPADRFGSGGELARALADPAFRYGEAAGAGAATGRGSWNRLTTALAMLAALSVLGAGLSWLRPTERANPVSLSFDLPPSQLLSIGNAVLDISRDGRRIVYVGEEGRDVQLYVRDLDGYGTRAVPGTTGGRFPFLSPDGERVGFFVDGVLRTLPVADGIPLDLGPAPLGPAGGARAGGSWGTDGTILFAAEGRLWRGQAGGGATEEVVLTAAAARVEAVSDPYILPGNASALASARWVPSEGEASALTVSVVIDLASGETRPLLELFADGTVPSGLSPRPRYVQPGFIVTYRIPGTVLAAPFDVGRGVVTGPVRPVVDDALRPAGSTAVFSVSESGTLVYATGGLDRELVIVERNGLESRVSVTARGYRFPAVSPDGRHVAVSVDPVPSELWVMDIVDGTERPIRTEGNNLGATWSPDGNRLAWAGAGSLYSVSWPGTDGINVIDWPFGGGLEWFADDRMLGQPTVGAPDIALLDMTTMEATDLVSSPARELRARLSTDGDWVAYASDLTGVEEVWVVPFDGTGPERQVSNGGGTEPHWSPDGTELFYRNGSAIWVVAVRATGSFEVLEPPRPLFPAPYDFSNGDNWDVLPDGRFLMIKGNPDVGREIRVMTGWIEGLVSD